MGGAGRGNTPIWGYIVTVNLNVKEKVPVDSELQIPNLLLLLPLRYYVCVDSFVIAEIRLY